MAAFEALLASPSIEVHTHETKRTSTRSISKIKVTLVVEFQRVINAGSMVFKSKPTTY